MTRRRPEELAFLEEVARLATSARTWDELMVTVVDRATAAADTEVCSLYLMDRDGAGVTLAATNGLPASQVGVARLPLGVGITGRVAQARAPIVSDDVHADPRFHWLPGVDEPRYTSMCSVPLVWNDAVVGVLNVQTVRRRRFRPADVRFLETLAALLAGIVEKGRLQREAEAQVESLRAIDEARASLVTVVTHDLRTPLAVVRGSVELAAAAARAAGTDAADRWEREALRQVDRIDRTVDSIIAGLRALREEPPRLHPIDVVAVVDRTMATLAPILRRHELRASFPVRPLVAMASEEPLGRVLEYLLENAAKYGRANGRIEVAGSIAGDRVRLSVADDGPGIPPEWRESIFEPFVRLADSPRGAGIGLFAARRIARSMGGDVRIEENVGNEKNGESDEGGRLGGSRFVLELSAVRPGGSQAE